MPLGRLVACLMPLALVLTAACGGRSPMSPTTDPGGATINGAVVAPGSGQASGADLGAGLSPANVPPGLVVSIDGTMLSAAVSSGGAFAFQDAPAGDLTLRFTSATVNGTLALTGVQQSETIDLAVSVADSSIQLESQARRMGGDTELEGRIEAFPAATAADDLVVAGQTVLTDASTTVYFGSTAGEFDDLQIGWRVHVKGNAAGPDVLATSIIVQNVNPDIQYPINGVIENFTGSPDEFEFMIGRHVIKGDDDTEFFGNSAFDDLADGERAEVKSLLRDGYFYAFRIHVEHDDTDDEDDEGQDDSASIEGLLTGLGGTAPTLTFMVGTTIVRTDATTVVQRKGDVQTLDQLVENMLVHVVGDRQADGSLDARKVQIKDDEVGGAFQIEGSVGGLKGTCPTVSFGVNGYAIVTDAATIYDPASPGCSGLKSGHKVSVDGIVQAGGTILATKIAG